MTFIVTYLYRLNEMVQYDVYECLCSEGIIVRQMNEYNLPNYLRITIGTEKANKLIISSLREFMK